LFISAATLGVNIVAIVFGGIGVDE
jgi:hypothetical protein